MNKTLYDKDIREPLFDFLEGLYGKVRFFEEKMIGRSRADVMMVIDDALVGIEIKSDADTYARLKRQVRDYKRFFDYNYIVIGTSHAQHIFEHVPADWGIITVEMVTENTDALHLADGHSSKAAGHTVSAAKPAAEYADFYVLRKPQKNTSCKMQNKLSFLWKKELLHIKEGYIKYKYTDKSKAFISRKLIDKIPADTLDRLISQELFERDYTLLYDTEGIPDKYKSGKGRLI